MLFEIIPDDAGVEVRGSLDQLVAGVAIDSRLVSSDVVFIAIDGAAVDGHAYIGMALDAGATTIVCDDWPTSMVDGVTYVKVGDTRKYAGRLAHAFYDYPSEHMALVGVTGTNGKTTIATLLYQLYTGMGYVVGLVSTVENRVGDTVLASTHTTPDPISLNALLYQMRHAGCTHVFMEVSSHSLDQGRVDGLEFDVAIFTNMSHDHLDYHGSFKEYVWAKKKLFDGLNRSATAIINIDDKRGPVMVQNCAASVLKYSLRSMADYRVKVLADTVEGLQLSLDGATIYCRMSGRYNAYNLLAVLATAETLGDNREDVLPILSNLTGAEGRLERVAVEGVDKIGFVDYAHTPDALDNVVKTLRHTMVSAAQLIVVIGAGGDRDSLKRPEMARIATRLADRVILTSDNPRTESPEAILDDMEAGVEQEQRHKSIRITDRAQAIRTAVLLARSGDIILVAGKGHEKYQDIMGEKLPFDDKVVLQEALGLS